MYHQFFAAEIIKAGTCADLRMILDPLGEADMLIILRPIDQPRELILIEIKLVSFQLQVRIYFGIFHTPVSIGYLGEMSVRDIILVHCQFNIEVFRYLLNIIK